MKVLLPRLASLLFIVAITIDFSIPTIPDSPLSSSTDLPAIFTPSAAAAFPTLVPTPLHTEEIPPSTTIPIPTGTIACLTSPKPNMTQVNATVWIEEPIVPILTLHQFKPDGISPSDFNGHKLQISDFRSALAGLYDNGFSLISLEDWLTGHMVVADGRRPLIMTMDDLFFTNQIYLDENGTPNPDTGIGALWQFYNQHPTFDFHISLFAVLGDKYYPADPSADSEWEIKLAKTIAWCIEHGAMIYNHTYMHACLDKIPIKEFINQLDQNDIYLRQLLIKGGREDLIPLLGNMIALPGGIAPETLCDWAKLRGYQNPEGEAVQAILHIYSPGTNPSKWDYLRHPYDPEFDPYGIIRIAANFENMHFLIDNRDKFPAAKSCTLSLEESCQDDDACLIEQILIKMESGACPAGLYVLDERLFDARSTPVTRMFMP